MDLRAVLTELPTYSLITSEYTNLQNKLEDMATHQNRFLLIVNRECLGHGPYNLADFGYINLIYLKFINHCVSQTWSNTVGLSRIEGTTSFGIGTCDELPLKRLTFR